MLSGRVAGGNEPFLPQSCSWPWCFTRATENPTTTDTFTSSWRKDPQLFNGFRVRDTPPEVYMPYTGGQHPIHSLYSLHLVPVSLPLGKEVRFDVKLICCHEAQLWTRPLLSTVSLSRTLRTNLDSAPSVSSHQCQATSTLPTSTGVLPLIVSFSKYFIL